MERALQKLLTREKRLKMKEKARYIVIDPEQKEEQAFLKKQSTIQKLRRSSVSRVNYSDGFFSSEGSSELSQNRTFFDK